MLSVSKQLESSVQLTLYNFILCTLQLSRYGLCFSDLSFVYLVQ